MTDNTPVTITGKTFLRLTERAALADTLLLERDDLLTRIAMLRQEVADEQARNARLTDALRLCRAAIICQSTPGMPLSAIECKAVGAASAVLAAEQETKP